MEVSYKEVQTKNEFIGAIRPRVDVFIKEQGFQPGWEPDEDDKTSKEFIGIANGIVVATARFKEMAKGKMKLKPKKIWLRSQLQSEKFYEKYGFVAVSKPHEKYGVTHIDMEYKPTSATAGSR